MEIKVILSDEQIEKVFTYHGFKIVEQENPTFEHIHGSRFIETKISQRFVENPMNGDLILVKEAFDKLVQRMVQNQLFGISKTEVIQSLMNN